MLCSTFRHSGWTTRRRLVFRGLTDAGVTASRLQRFASCGSTAWVLRSAEPPTRFRLATNRCRDRFCVPCAVEHQRVVSQNIIRSLAGRVLRFMTLTLRSSDAPLTEVITRLYRCFASLRRSKAIGIHMTGGLYFLELTLNNATLQWHPHLHILFEGGFIPVKLLSLQWQKITGDSYIVDLRALRDEKAAAGYVAKYAGKAIASNVVMNREKLAEVVTGLSGRRLFSCFGSWKALKLSRHDEDGGTWTCVGHLSAVLTEARRGVVPAMMIIRQLRCSNVPDPLTLFDRAGP